MAALTGANAMRRWGARRVGAAVAVIGPGTWAIEAIGSRTGIPFGRYRYTDVLRPTLGSVPAIVPAAWFAMAVPAREVAHATLGRHSTPIRRVVLGAAALTAWDLFLDPQMVGEGYWRWSRVGRYRGIPATNFLGWLVAGAAVMGVLERALPPAAEPDPALVAEYGFIGVMETVGFARYFGDPLVAAVGGAAMLPFPVVAAARSWRRPPGGA